MQTVVRVGKNTATQAPPFHYRAPHSYPVQKLSQFSPHLLKTDWNATCVKALVDQSPNNGSFGAQYKSQSSLSKICVNKLHLGKQGFLSNYRS